MTSFGNLRMPLGRQIVAEDVKGCGHGREGELAMILTIAEIAEAFSDHRFTEVYPYLSDDVRWTVIGDRLIAGKADVIAACDESAAYLATATTEFSRFKLVVGEDAAVVDARATYTDAEKNTFAVASCDIYEFADGMVSEITSYNVEVT
jgi:hypothetical protein